MISITFPQRPCCVPCDLGLGALKKEHIHTVKLGWVGLFNHSNPEPRCLLGTAQWEGSLVSVGGVLGSQSLTVNSWGVEELQFSVSVPLVRDCTSKDSFAIPFSLFNRFANLPWANWSWS